MKQKKTWTRMLSLAMAMAMLSSVPAWAAPDTYAAAGSIEEAKAALADVAITQVYNGETRDSASHDYRVKGDKVEIDYSATLKMTEEMALYLLPRQKQLMKADFNVHVNMDMEWLEFRDDLDTVTVTFSSTFLKPVDKAGLSYRLVSDQDGIFTYEMTMSKKDITSEMVIPMELIVYYDAGNKTAYGYDDAKGKFADKPLMYAEFTAEDWMHIITLKTAGLKVKDEKAKTVTTDKSTWYWVIADGTVDGKFSYISDSVDTIGEMKEYEDLNYVNELKFGNDQEIREWVSNEVKVLLKRTAVGGGGGGGELLNKDDHYSYIIGYGNDIVRPYGNITRAEVATIFFRMLTDEVRDKYWSKTNGFTDVPAERWYNNAISTLYNMGKETGRNIINGFEDGSFRPDDMITRAEFAKIAVGFFDETVKEYQGYYPDVEKDAWYASYVEAAHRVGLILGFEDGTFRPTSNITRAEACTIMNRTLDRHPEEHKLLPTEVMVNWVDNDPDAWYYADIMEATNSHDYHWVESGKVDENGKPIHHEEWTKKLPQRNWVEFERVWSDAHSSQGGEVVKD